MQGYREALASPEGLAGLPEWAAYTTEDPRRLPFLEGGATGVIGDEAFLAEHNCGPFVEMTR